MSFLADRTDGKRKTLGTVWRQRVDTGCKGMNKETKRPQNTLGEQVIEGSQHWSEGTRCTLVCHLAESWVAGGCTL